MVITRRLAALTATTVATVASWAAMTGVAQADYGAGAAFQVEISANTSHGSFWIWAELDPSAPGAMYGASGDYQETDCIHLGGGHATDAAAHDSGSVSGWWVSNGALTMTGIKIIDSLETATISIPTASATGLGHSNGMTLTVTSSVLPDPTAAGLPPIGVSIPFPSQNQVAP
jgi:hypothetical protein